ncbi:Lymphoid-restricted membrane protein [Bagarius yarrelli]|uniref:Lymphoid-restricted membrane protein n=1 Tax=Bagarius yarrelli TaxID=175774 RepID=A0A556V9X9_BAGYA|nr:Lymphoid-restricted membrane protein [Bagarius yarrelli]
MASGNVNAGWKTPDISAQDESSFSSQQDGEHQENSALSLSMDSGTSSVELSQLQSDNENFRPCDRYLCDMSGFSEEELLNITFEACDAAGRGEVLASTVVQFLQAMTGHSGGQDKLIVLKHMLDPEGRDPAMDKDAFHTTMKKWITQCSQDGDTGDLLGLVAELKHAQHRLRGQNSSLLRSVSQCEEINLQLMMDVSELRSKLASAQLCEGRAQSLAEELDEARRALRESQERTSLAQANSHSLMKEIEHLKAHIKVMEEMNEKLLLERNSADDRLNKLKRADEDVGEELEEMRVLLAIKERENTKKNITLQKLKETYLDYHRIIDRTCVEENSGSVFELQPPSSPKTDLYNFIQKVKSAELQYVLSAESLQKAFLQDQQKQASTKQQLLTVLRDLERPRPQWGQQPECRQIETHRQTQEAPKAPPITWWKALRLEDMRHTWNTQDIQDTTREMQQRITALEAQLREAQMEVQKSRTELGEASVLTAKADVAVQTEQVADEWKCVAAEKVLESLRKVEAVVTRALKAAEVLTESERRMRERMEAISHKVEEVLSRTTDTEKLLSGLEERDSSCTKDKEDTTGTLNGLSEQLKCESVVLLDSSSDHHPVGPLNKHNPPVQNCSEGGSTAAHNPVTSTSPSAACEERTHHDTREKEARFHLGSKETGGADDSLLKSNSDVTLQDDQTFKLKKNKDPNPKQDDTGTSQISASSGSSLSEPTEVFNALEKEWSAEPEQFDQTFQKANFILNEGAEKSSGCSEEKTNKNVKDSVTEWTSSTAESENIRSSDPHEGGSVYVSQVQTTEPAETLESLLNCDGCVS